MSWTEQANSPADTWRSISMSADGVKIVATTTGEDAYASFDSGAAWSALPVPSAFSADISDDGQTIVVAGYTTNSTVGKIFSLRDGGATFTSFDTGYAHYASDVSMSSDGSKIAVTRAYVFTLTDCGQTWTKQTNPQAISASNIDIDLDTPGQQLTVDKTDTKGWKAMYDPTSDTFVINGNFGASASPKPVAILSYSVAVPYGYEQPTGVITIFLRSLPI